MMHRLFIIDGHSILYKAYYAIRGLSTKSGIPTNAIFGFAQMLFRVIREAQPHHICVTFDSKAPTFRKELYPEYKANRPVMPDDLQVQVPYVEKMLDALNIRRIARDGFEADDIIATLVRKAEEYGWEARIVTADKDLFQIVSDKTHVLRFGKKDIEDYDINQVKEKMGVPPERIVDLLALMGDSSDNIPGITGIGGVTARKLLNEYQSLENLIRRADTIKNENLREKIKTGADTARLSRKLATVKKDLELETDFESFRYENKLTPDLESLFQELEFKSLLASLKQDTGTKSKQGHALPSYQIIRRSEELVPYLRSAFNEGILAIDTETTSTDAMRCRLVGISLSFKPGEAKYIPLSHTPAAACGEQMSLESLKSELSPILLSNDVKKCGQNMKYDIKVLHRVGLDMVNVSFDTMLASWLLDPERGSHGLKNIAPEEIGLPMRPITDLLGSGKNSITMAEVSVGDACDYACRDADAALQLVHHFNPKLKEAGLYDLFTELEMALVPILAQMEWTGIAIDIPYFKNLSRETKSVLQGFENECYELAGHPFNLNSPKQVAAVLFEEMRLTPAKKGKSGFSTDVKVLEGLAKEHPLPKKLLEYRSHEKLLSTYIDTLPQQVNPETGRVHTTFIQTGTATGRLSSRDPNLQNIPVRTPQGRAIRKGFIPGEKGWLLLSADYSQIELRILAHLSGDDALVRAFSEGEDIHKITAARIFGMPEEMVTDEMRDTAKVINFGVIYGMTAHRLSTEIGIPIGDARRFIDEYFKIYKGSKKWIDRTIHDAAEKGYVTTLLGRRRYIPDLKSPNKTIRAAAERIAINTPLQGASADMIKRAMVFLHKRLAREKLKGRLLIQVHDELVFETPEDEVEDLTALVKEEMEGALRLNVPVKVGVKTGSNWAEC